MSRADRHNSLGGSMTTPLSGITIGSTSPQEEVVAELMDAWNRGLVDVLGPLMAMATTSVTARGNIKSIGHTMADDASLPDRMKQMASWIEGEKVWQTLKKNAAIHNHSERPWWGLYSFIDGDDFPIDVLTFFRRHGKNRTV